MARFNCIQLFHRCRLTCRAGGSTPAFLIPVAPLKPFQELTNSRQRKTNTSLWVTDLLLACSSTMFIKETCRALDTPKLEEKPLLYLSHFLSQKSSLLICYRVDGIAQFSPVRFGSQKR